MLNKRYCPPTKGLKSGCHCALSSLLIVLVVVVVVVATVIVNPRKKERENEGVLPANANLLIPSVPGSLCSKQIRRNPPPPPPPSSCHFPLLFDRATCLSDGKTCIDWISRNINGEHTGLPLLRDRKSSRLFDSEGKFTRFMSRQFKPLFLKRRKRLGIFLCEARKSNFTFLSYPQRLILEINRER